MWVFEHNLQELSRKKKSLLSYNNRLSSSNKGVSNQNHSPAKFPFATRAISVKHDCAAKIDQSVILQINCKVVPLKVFFVISHVSKLRDGVNHLSC